MRIVAFYRTYDLNTLRRLIGPLSVLSQRGHQSFFQLVSDVREMQVANYHLIFLPNWAVPLHQHLPPAQGVYVYDLSDPDLLLKEEVVHTISQCQVVTVPAPGLVPIVKAFCPRVKVVPSLVHAELYLRAIPLDFAHPTIACVGNHDWELVAEPLKDALKTSLPNAHVLTDNMPLKNYLADRAGFAAVDTTTFPSIARSVSLALLPRKSDDRDTGWANEFGITGTPVIASPAYGDVVDDGETGVIARNADQWKKAVVRVMQDDKFRVRISMGIQADARRNTTVRGADAWLAAMKKFAA